MAGVRVLGVNPTVLVRSPTVTEDAIEVVAQATPSNIGFVRVIAYQTWLDHGPSAPLQPIADHIEQIVANHHVVSGGPVQKIDAAGLVSNWVQFVITTATQARAPSQTFTAPVLVPVQALHDLDNFAHYFEPVEKALAA